MAPFARAQNQNHYKYMGPASAATLLRQGSNAERAYGQVMTKGGQGPAVVPVQITKFGIGILLTLLLVPARM